MVRAAHPDLIVGIEHADDAGVVRLNAEQALVQTVDFFTPIVDDARMFGAIAAANAMSDVYAMGGEPLTVLNIVCFPNDKLPIEVLQEILLGAGEKVAEAKAILAGGHSVRDPELKFGLSVTGLVHPERVWANQGARPGDALVLTKPLGTGVLSTALKSERISNEEMLPAAQSMARLNRDAMLAAKEGTVHACTDVTGNGLVGHAWEMARSSECRLVLTAGELPLLQLARELAAEGMVPGGARANERYVGDAFSASDELAAGLRDVALCPETSGGLLISLPASDADALIGRLAKRGVTGCRIGRVEAGEAGVHLGP